MDIIFIGGVFTKDDEAAIQKASKSMLQFAANKFQLALINGIMKDCRIDKLLLVNAPFLGGWPNNSHILSFKRHLTYVFEGVHYFPVKFNNIMLVKQVSRFINTLVAIIKAAKQIQSKEPPIILVYSAHTPFMWAAIIFRYYSNFKTQIWLVLPDLPNYFNLNSTQGLMYRFFKWLDMFIYKAAMNRIDGFVLLTNHMKHRINQNLKPSVIIEGVYYSDPGIEYQSDLGIAINPDALIFFYAGGLAKAYGIETLISAFRAFDLDNAVLVIAGLGECQPFVFAESEIDKRIKYLGQINSQSVDMWLKKSHYLVNPRPNTDEFTKYSFPSKIIEYFASGTPTIMCRLDGIPDEYYDHAIIIEDESLEAMLNAFRKASQTSEDARIRIGESARNFILNNKTAVMQCKKIIDAMSSNLIAHF